MRTQAGRVKLPDEIQIQGRSEPIRHPAEPACGGIAAFVVCTGSGIDVVALSCWEQAEQFATMLAGIDGGLAGPVRLRTIGHERPSRQWALDLPTKRWIEESAASN
jgi:hypothetical protein